MFHVENMKEVFKLFLMKGKEIYMQIKEMFAKPIDRDLQGVIIVGQDEIANVKQELEEYVVTRELQKHFGFPVSLEAVNLIF